MNRSEFERNSKHPLPAGSRSLRYAAWAVVLLALLHLLWLQLQSESGLYQVWSAAMKSPASQAAVAEKEFFDQLARQAGTGNVLLSFTGAGRADMTHVNQLCYLYYRCAYALYPRRIYVGPADRTVNDGDDIIRTRFNPSRQWLQAHDVRAVLTFDGGQPVGRALQLNFLPPPDSPPGARANRSGGD